MAGFPSTPQRRVEPSSRCGCLWRPPDPVPRDPGVRGLAVERAGVLLVVLSDEKPADDESLEEAGARVFVEPPEPLRLPKRQAQSGHFQELATNPSNQLSIECRGDHWNVLVTLRKANRVPSPAADVRMASPLHCL